MEFTYQYLDVKLPTEDPEDAMLDIVKVLRPTWRKEDVDIKFLSGGFINKMYGIHLESDTDLKDGIVIRINSEVTSGVGSDRESELKTLLALNSKGLGVKVLASFRNGIIFEYLKGQPLNDDQMRDKHIISLVATELAKMHASLPLDTDSRADPLYVTRKTFDSIPLTPEDSDKQAEYSANIPYEEVKTENLALQEHLLSQNMDLVIGHGDLWQGNIMYDPQKDTVTFIDYEQSEYQFAAWDIAFDLATTAGTPPDYENHYPSDDLRKLFVRQYLKEKLKATESEEVTDEAFATKFKEFYVQVCKCELLALLHLANQCLYCLPIADTDINMEDFDFMGMAIDAWNEYKKRKSQHMGIKPEDVSFEVDTGL